MLSASIAVLALAAGAFSSPVARQSTGTAWCPLTLGGGAFDVAYNFTLAAWNSTLPNANSTGAPIVVGQAGAVDGASFKVLSTYASYPYNEFPTYTLDHGALHPNSAPPYNVGISDAAVVAGGAPAFEVTVNPPPAAQIYCAVADTDPAGGGTGFPWLAVNGDTDSFSLCSAGDYNLAQTNVVWKANNASYSGYVYDTCYPVKLQLIGLD